MLITPAIVADVAALAFVVAKIFNVSMPAPPLIWSPPDRVDMSARMVSLPDVPTMLSKPVVSDLVLIVAISLILIAILLLLVHLLTKNYDIASLAIGKSSQIAVIDGFYCLLKMQRKKRSLYENLSKEEV